MAQMLTFVADHELARVSVFVAVAALKLTKWYLFFQYLVTAILTFLSACCQHKRKLVREHHLLHVFIEIYAVYYFYGNTTYIHIYYCKAFDP